MNIVFRVDSGRNIGAGHLMRCLYLASALRDRGASVRFVTRDHRNNRLDVIQDAQFDVTVLPRASEPTMDPVTWLGTSQENDLEQTEAAISDHGPYDWAVVDHYGIGTPWLSSMARTARRVLVIDDLANRPLRGDLVLNQNLSASEEAYSSLVPPETELRLGPHYALLNPDLRAPSSAGTGTGRASLVPRLLICFGGSDPKDLTSIALQRLESRLRQFRQIDVVLGHQHPSRTDLVRGYSSRPNVVLHDYVPPSTMARLMASADVAVGSGGISALERLAAGLPSVIAVAAENQRAPAQALAREGLAYLWDPCAQNTRPALTSLVDTLRDSWVRHAMSQRGHEYVDGRGTHRIANAMWNWTYVYLRPARKDDAELMHTWRNDERTRRHFLDPTPLDWKEHVRWLEAVLARDDRHLLVAQDGDVAVGIIRFDVDAERSSADVSIYLDPDCQGRGYGEALLRAGERWLAEHEKEVSHLAATVMAANEASRRAFQKAGYRPYATSLTRHLSKAQRPIGQGEGI